MIRASFILVTLFFSMAFAGEVPSVVGTWKLVAMERQPVEGKAASYCPSPSGLLTYTAQGYVSVGINCMKLNDAKALVIDPQNAIFYVGTYAVHDHAMSHHIMNANTLDFFGKDVERELKFETENKIIINGKGPNGEISRLIWERITP